jgi:aminoglycoside phosphotransferase (APT) family kinase protein
VTVQPIGPKLAEGRDSEIFEHGQGRVLRIPRDGRSLEHEARVMEHVRAQGYPVPAVHEAGDGYLVMDRIDGTPLFDVATKPPFPIPRVARLLADLHNRLHDLRAPDWLPPAPVAGDRIVHMDLHPLNVLMTADGPVVIDWSNARAGDPSIDVADTWVLLASARPDDLKPWERVLVRLGRTWILETFLKNVADRDAARRAIPAAVEHRALDRNMSPAELERMRELAAWASNLPAP